jgi:hypothetical protein
VILLSGVIARETDKYLGDIEKLDDSPVPYRRETGQALAEN